MNAIGGVFDSWGWILLLQALARHSPVYTGNSCGTTGPMKAAHNAIAENAGEFSQPGVGSCRGGHIDILA